MSVPASPQLGPSRAGRVTLAAASAAAMVFELVVPIAILQVYDRVIPNASVESLIVLIIGASVLLGLDFLVRYARHSIISHSSAAAAHRLSRIAIERVAHGDVRQISRRGAGENLALLGAVRATKDQASGQRIVTFTELLLIPLVIGVIAVMAGPLAFVPTAAIALFALVSLWNGMSLGKAISARSSVDSERFDFIFSTLRSIQTVKSLSLEDLWRRKYERRKLDACVSNHEVSNALTRTFDAAACFSTFTTFSILLTGAIMVVEGWITVGALIASVILSGRIAQPVQRSLAYFVRSRDVEIEREKAREMLATPSLHSGLTDTAGENEGRLELNGVSYATPAGGALLSGADLSVRPGQCLVLDTEDPITQSELLKLMAGLRIPDEGDVLLNGVRTDALSFTIRARQAGYLPREAVIYRGTVLQNLTRFGESSLDDVLYVARLLDLESDVALLPGGLETVLRGDSADHIPPGMKQRIAIARQLAPRPRLILFDDADTGLDRRSFDAVQKLFVRLKGKATLILATSDQNLRALAETRIEIADGRFVTSEIKAKGDLEVARYREVRL